MANRPWLHVADTCTGCSSSEQIRRPEKASNGSVLYEQHAKPLSPSIIVE